MRIINTTEKSNELIAVKDNDVYQMDHPLKYPVESIDKTRSDLVAKIEIEVKNTGPRDGALTLLGFLIPPQISTIDSTSAAYSINKILRGFTKINLSSREMVHLNANIKTKTPGSAKVEWGISKDDLLLTNLKGEKEFVKGEWKILITGTNNMKLETTFTV